ncbi:MULTISPECIES: hypothetical protein [Ramlibacter]|uniref:Uncharacterized protein n=1 Tax=Ramlibacter pinisoli TaxID=2682844 RepID=A0A6N8IYZ4_9BURK|nr:MULTISPECIES: hypothetical protein [Ramlibacter]MBA2961870.1 hypothetical protein [Ramlibacter sp. CGMCC 1.13660]MVQ31812.1 hypothetical protein [Ramlibacter pinisoli]
MKQAVAQGPRGCVVLMDSITRVEPQDAGSVVVSASHGGTSSGRFALEVPLALVFFNDAGVGKDGAGIAALAMLEQRRIPAACVAHTSARIGDVLDTWENGVVSFANASAVQAGISPGDRLAAAAVRYVGVLPS